ncbi:TetR family transcriptional regulator [Streptomyces cinnamoneus]|uniref:TetR family transcriptional regulator n=1 Tax=Streptomyces cinnamoneus TaxID=53446 RepID=A0A2G1XAH7_STRCJ|nr:TetR/AcrR family transcriptional regulator [Streptomyces cinnamoneus]PHQ48228.1 TetR family transcriptional regulator [Streptomyces cinnamoneus]PPT15855.1 TetR family transcriptional regulator [Streptomyces cinnamoneus]
MSAGTTGPKRDTYRHGDLRNALIEAGLELARQGGPEAVVLRATTRQAGVVPNAAYRHFADRGALLHAVSQAAMARVARTMEAEQAALPPAADEAAAARARFRAVGTGYLRFAQEEPGLFRAAFHVPGDMTHAAADTAAGTGGKTPFELLGAALDDLVEAGLLPADRRPGAEFLAWSAVHGLAVLLIDGPLRGLHPSQAHDAGQHVIDMIERGI